MLLMRWKHEGKGPCCLLGGRDIRIVNGSLGARPLECPPPGHGDPVTAGYQARLEKRRAARFLLHPSVGNELTVQLREPRRPNALDYHEPILPGFAIRGSRLSIMRQQVQQLLGFTQSLEIVE